jgi:hypothetical protein
MRNKDSIKAFVQQTLGCGCPEEVFQHITCRSNLRIDDVTIRYKICIGDRLLIYAAEAVDADSVRKQLHVLIDAGKRERDSSGFNRFRLVLFTDRANEIRDIAEDLFHKGEKDEKIHLHIIAKSGMPVFSET